MMDAIQALNELPGRIRKARTDLWEARDVLARLELEEKKHEAAAYARASAEIGPDGKRLYTNEAAREAASRVALREDQAAMDLRRQIRDRRLLVDRIDATLDFLRDVQKNSRVVLMTRCPFDVLLDDAELAA